MVDIINTETNICQFSAKKVKNNCNAWSHLQYCIQLLVIKQGLICLNNLENAMQCSECMKTCFVNILKLLKAGVSQISSYLKQNISDTSGWMYLNFILTNWTYLTLKFIKFKGENQDSISEICELWQQVLQNNTELIETFSAGFESLWYFRRQLFLTYYNLEKIHKEFSLFKLGELLSLQNEKKFQNKFNDNAPNVEPLTQQYFANRHVQFFVMHEKNT